jgi:hypothetical protein
MDLLLEMGPGFQSVLNKRKKKFSSQDKPAHGSLSWYTIRCIVALEASLVQYTRGYTRAAPLVYTSISMTTTHEGTPHAASSDRPDISARPRPKAFVIVSGVRGHGMRKETRTFWLLESKQRQNSRCNIAQRTLFLILFSILVIRKRERTLGILRPRDNKGNLVGRVRRVWRTCFQVHHLLRVTMISRYDEGVARLLARLIDRADRCVSVCDGLDSSLENACMANLWA